MCPYRITAARCKILLYRVLTAVNMDNKIGWMAMPCSVAGRERKNFIRNIPLPSSGSRREQVVP